MSPRLERCAELRELEPERLRGIWLREHKGYDDVHAELGCGKGRFTAETALGAPKILFAAIERSADAQITAMERVADMRLRNVRFITRDARDAALFFGEGELGRIYINFCDPWPSARHAKRRLTAPAFLEMYKCAIKPGGEIHFKTDNSDLFDYSLRRFEACGFELADVTRDLHAAGANGVMTDYEEKFRAQGAKICRCVARR
ncbi:MAG: tRNA (guanosine(46)-N7)-methyltransferase TrmB [Oscillospiraceae bacterium]|nr:tRNA (guanosine(46)-N7)-methyltransferase TrmB [Oscillospiraceae bacterium]